MIVGYNSTGHQMVEKRSSLKGPDTINVSSVAKTYCGSILIKEAEAFLCANRTNIKSPIQRLIDHEMFSAIMMKE